MPLENTFLQSSSGADARLGADASTTPFGPDERPDDNISVVDVAAALRRDVQLDDIDLPDYDTAMSEGSFETIDLGDEGASVNLRVDDPIPIMNQNLDESLIDSVEDENARLDQSCPICLTEYGAINDEMVRETPVTTQCGHTFGHHCITHWITTSKNGTCPLCRTHLFRTNRSDSVDRLGLRLHSEVIMPRRASTGRDLIRWTPQLTSLVPRPTTSHAVPEPRLVPTSETEPNSTDRATNLLQQIRALDEQWRVIGERNNGLYRRAIQRLDELEGQRRVWSAPVRPARTLMIGSNAIELPEHMGDERSHHIAIDQRQSHRASNLLSPARPDSLLAATVPQSHGRNGDANHAIPQQELSIQAIRFASRDHREAFVDGVSAATRRRRTTASTPANTPVIISPTRSAGAQGSSRLLGRSLLQHLRALQQAEVQLSELEARYDLDVGRGYPVQDLDSASVEESQLASLRGEGGCSLD